MPGGDRRRWGHARARGLGRRGESAPCGAGCGAGAPGERSHAVLALALEALTRVAHRGAAATDSSGDGAGVLTQLPSRLLRRDATRLGLQLSGDEPFALGMFFLPQEREAQDRVIAIIEDVLRGDGLRVL